jgi:TDG/mug DNA glycosylase family protein
MKPKTLPDQLAPGLDIVSIGINPSIYSVERGFYFARPGNRFWPTLNASGLVPERLEPSRDAVVRLFRVHRIGFTDLVKRATARAEDLTGEDYALGARLLRRKLRRFQPAIAWFHGTSGYRIFLKHSGVPRTAITPGLQPDAIGASRVFVTPNPSGANPAANPKALLPLYRELAELRGALGRRR